MRLVGRLARQPCPVFVAATRTEMCQIEVLVEDQVYPVTLRGELAKRISAVPGGSLLSVEGRLRCHDWKVGKHSLKRLEIEAEEFELLQSSRRSLS